MERPTPGGEDRREFLKRAAAAAAATVWAVPTMQVVSMPAARAGIVGSVVPPAPTSTSTNPDRLILHSLRGEFESDVEPGSAPFWKRLENGSFDGEYSVPEFSFPAVSGTSLTIPEFEIVLRDESGAMVIRYVSGRDSGGFFADFFGPGSGDGFVFSDGAAQFQLGFVSGFDGSGAARDGAVFSAAGAPFGEIGVESAAATVLG